MSSKDYPEEAEGKVSERIDDSKSEGKQGDERKGEDLEDREEADTKMIERVQEYFYGNEGRPKVFW